MQRQSPYGEMRHRPLPLMSKGEEEQEKEQANKENVLPSMPKGETVGKVVIDGNIDGKGGS